MVLVFAEATNGKFKKAAQEAVTYGAKTAAVLGTECHALTLGTVDDAGDLGRFGATKVYNVAGPHLAGFDSSVYTAAIAGAAQQVGAKVIVLMHNSTGKNLVAVLPLGSMQVLHPGSIAYQPPKEVSPCAKRSSPVKLLPMCRF